MAYHEVSATPNGNIPDGEGLIKTFAAETEADLENLPTTAAENVRWHSLCTVDADSTIGGGPSVYYLNAARKWVRVEES